MSSSGYSKYWALRENWGGGGGWNGTGCGMNNVLRIIYEVTTDHWQNIKAIYHRKPHDSCSSPNFISDIKIETKPNATFLWIEILHCVRKVQSSNVGMHTCCTGTGFSSFSSVRPRKCRHSIINQVTAAYFCVFFSTLSSLNHAVILLHTQTVTKKEEPHFE
jgi:hypothetical protein